MVKERGRKLIAQNSKARYDYHIEDTFEAGLVLTGTEVKSLRPVAHPWSTASPRSRSSEVWLHGAHIPEYSRAPGTTTRPRRKRKLLLHRHEIDKMERRVNERGLTIVPLALYFKDGRAKVEIAPGQGQEALRQAPDDRQARRRARGHPRARPPGQGLLT